mgnify:CR=1 FL=1
MALDAFLSFDGKIKGSVRQQGREGKIRLFAVDHTMGAVADAESGFPTKTVMPRAMIVTKSVDLSSAPMQTALAENTKFGSVNVEMWRMPPTGGVEENHYTIVMTGVRIASIRLVMRFNKPPENMQLPETEEVALSYEGIAFTYKSLDGSNNCPTSTRDKFDETEDKLKSALVDGLKGAAKDLGSSIGSAIKEAMKDAGKPAGG